jgi:hypothetical protein
MNTPGLCASFKAEVLSGIHALGVPPIRATAAPDAIKAALYLTTGSLSNLTSVYAPANEVSGAGYTAGGIAVAAGTAPTTSGTSAIWTPSSNLVWPALTLSVPFDTLLLYNATQGNRAIAVYNIGAQTIAAGTLTLTMPVNAPGSALIGLA